MPEPSISFVRPNPPARIVAFDARPRPVEVDLARSALVVVDMQNDFIHPDGWFPRAGVDTRPLRRPIPTIARLTDELRTAGLPIIWLGWGVRGDRANLPPPLLRIAGKSGGRPIYADPAPSGNGRILVQSEWGAASIAELPAQPGDLMVYKHRLSGFWDNELDSVLRGRGVDTLLFAGVNIDRCVFATLCDASFLGYGNVLIEDACATVSPQFVSDAVLYLIHELYGVSTTSAVLLDAIATSTLSPSPTTANGATP